MAAFRERQAADVVRRRKPFVQRVEEQLRRDRDTHRNDYSNEYADDDEWIKAEAKSSDGQGYIDHKHSGEEAWRNSEGERLKDFGVDEDIEFYDEQKDDDDDDDVPLSELVARRRAAQTANA